MLARESMQHLSYVAHFLRCSPSLVVSTSNCLQTYKPNTFATSFKYQRSCQYYQKSIYCTMKRIAYASFRQTVLLCSCILRVAVLKHCWCLFGCAFKLLYHVLAHPVKSLYLMNCFIKSVASRSTVEII